MQRLTLTIPVAGYSPGDAFEVFANADSAGRALAAIDYDNPISGQAAVPFFPGVQVPPAFLEGGFLASAWLGIVAGEVGFLAHTWLADAWLGLVGGALDRSVTTPLLYFGSYLFATKTYNAVGNTDPGTPDTFEVVVNSGPGPVRRFRQTGVAGNHPVFAIEAPTQFGVTT